MWEGFFMKKATKSENEIIKEADVVINEMAREIAEITEEEIAKMAIDWSKKCENVEFTPYISEVIQKQFFCMFDGLVEIKEVVKVDGENKKVCFEKTYKKDGFSYPIYWLNIASIKMLMKASLKLGIDIILESLANAEMKEVSTFLTERKNEGDKRIKNECKS